MYCSHEEADRGDGTYMAGLWVVETPLTLQVSRPTHFHTFILRPQSSILSVCVCTTGLLCVCASVIVFYKDSAKKKNPTQSTSMFSCVIGICIYASAHPTVVYCRLCCSRRYVALTCTELLL